MKIRKGIKLEESTRLETTVDVTGAVILPESVMKHLDLKTGDKIIITEENSKISMRKG